MFGFVMMTPQLFINYKLQSVAHLNWRTMTYKSLNTFIDDLFAFVIKMPLMHRLSCFRDDIVFFIFLYQRWIYRTDFTRVNEFGQCAEPTDEMIKEQNHAKDKDGGSGGGGGGGGGGDAKSIADAVANDGSDTCADTATIPKARRGARDKH